MADPRINVARYFTRIGYAGTDAPTLDTLRGIVAAHTHTIPFESLNPYTGQSVLLDLPALDSKIVSGGRGGYCFEQNLLLGDVLRQLGFSVIGLAARVMWNAPPSLQMPRSHMLLLVDLGTPYLVDVGFGGLTLTGALELRAGVEQSTTHESFRLLEDGKEFIMQASVRGEWRSLYRFDLQPQLAADYEPVNWYLSTHPESRFVTNLIAARVLPGKRYALLNREFAVHHLHGDTERRTIGTLDELIDVLERDFLIPMSNVASSSEKLARVLRSP